ncbi:AlpA family phage regulatory protein [Robbsia sp. Bb-Pol-6]|uniref:AlpA family phage regulatory protein n=1 Tax=Robbsia betulipollinis TaxID=2981849 RepID=A0ABT3ZPU0_9BURK|nr:AlpA family phage regulatory protein [Robbsia betulipollinis]MCY0388245.1 AlpA family phage regulatory protein [Robbsia betulipollinis]
MFAASPSRKMRPPKAADLCGVSVTTIWRYARTLPDFPKPIKLSPRVTVFDENELVSWLGKRAAESRQAA